MPPNGIIGVQLHGLVSLFLLFIMSKRITSSLQMEDSDAEWTQCKKRSDVWKHFLIDKSKNRVKCKKCQHIQANHSSTSNMLNHIRHQHFRK